MAVETGNVDGTTGGVALAVGGGAGGGVVSIAWENAARAAPKGPAETLTTGAAVELFAATCGVRADVAGVVLVEPDATVLVGAGVVVCVMMR